MSSLQYHVMDFVMRISRDGSRDRYIEFVSDAELDKLIFIGTVEWEKMKKFGSI